VTPAKIGAIPAARVTNSTDQSFTNGSYELVNFDTNVFLAGGMTHPTSGNADTGITVPIAGIYALTGGVYWSGTASTGVRQLGLYVDGGRVATVVEPATSGDQNYMEVTTLDKLSAGDTIQLVARETGEATATIFSNEQYRDNETPRLESYWVAPAP
jgi:hypothetical protein